MKGLATLAISMGMVLLLAGAVSGATRTHVKVAPLCHLPANARQRLADEYVQVYEVKETEMFACAYGRRKVYRLTSPYLCPSSACPEVPLAELKVAGPFIAYESSHQPTSNIINEAGPYSNLPKKLYWTQEGKPMSGTLN